MGCGGEAPHLRRDSASLLRIFLIRRHHQSYNLPRVFHIYPLVNKHCKCLVFEISRFRLSGVRLGLVTLA